MEVRHIHRRPRRRRNTVFSPALLCMAVVFLAIVYGIGASRFGTWLASRVVAPAILHAAPLPTPSPVPAAETPRAAADTETREISLPAIRCYGVQIGVYQEAANAAAQSDGLKKLGAAGYIVEDGDRSRVLAAGYPDESSMEKVRAQLSGDGVDSRSYEIATDGVRLRVSGTAAQLGDMEASLAFIASLPEKLSEAAIRFDRDSLSAAEGIEALAGIRANCRSHAAVFDGLDGETRALLMPMAAYLYDIEALIDEGCALYADESVRLSSAMKRLYLDAVLGYRTMAKALDRD